MTTSQASSSVVGPILVVDFGAQRAQLIVCRVREVGVYSKIMSHSMDVAAVLGKQPSVIILSGGPSSVYAGDTPPADLTLFDAEVSILDICYEFQVMAQALGGMVGRTGTCEYGHTSTRVEGGSCLFDGTPDNQMVWMNHGDAVQTTPKGFTVIASTSQTPVVVFKNPDRRPYGLQWYPEVLRSEHGQAALVNFPHEEAGLATTWTPSNIIDEQVAHIREQMGDTHVICDLSGGVDSPVAATLVHCAIGGQLTCIFIDHGLPCVDECEQVEHDYVEGTGIRVITVDKTEHFLDALTGVTGSETKRKIIDRGFIHFFEAAQRRVTETVGAEGGRIRFLVQGTLYPDVVEPDGGEGVANIRNHHNVGGLPEDLDFRFTEPLRELFKDEMRAIGHELGMPEKVVARQPFPGSGLGIRVIGEAATENLHVLQTANTIAREELVAAELDDEVWQCSVVLLVDVRSVGVQGDGCTCGHPVVLRPVSSEDAMTADWTRLSHKVLAHISNRITDSVLEISRAVLDYTSKPPGIIKWE